jgi:hypothetical protein
MTHTVLKVWINEQFIHVKTDDGLEAKTPFQKWSRLRDASSSERASFVLSPCGIHWPELDEDLSFGGIFYEAGLCESAGCEESFLYKENAD